ncbi:MAG: DoxX family membrane protein [Vicingaceae bacterium]|nr:DoxX family membrane protein [Vicingaceae bacterium]
MSILNTIIRISIGLFFILSGISKLFPIEPFEATLVNLGITNWFFVPFLARIIIGIELFLGLCILFDFWLRNFIYLCTQILLILFTIYLVLLLYFEGNDIDCGCFGNWLSISPFLSIIKNLILITILFFIKRTYYAWGLKLLPLLFLLISFSFPFLINRVGLQHVQAIPLNQKIDWSRLPNTYLSNEKINFDEGNKILVFFSASCPHCESAAYKLGTLNKKNNITNVIIVIATKKEETLTKLITKTALNYPIIWMKEESFFNYSGGILPAIYYIENGVLKKRWTGKYFNIEELISYVDYK